MFDKLYVKITTLPQTENLSVDSMEFKVYKKKYEEAKEFVKDSDVLHSYIQDSSKNPSFGKIYSITLGYVNEQSIRIKTLKGEEKDILQGFLNVLQSKAFVNAELVGFNFGFLFSFFTTRMVKNGLDISSVPLQIRHLGLRSWNLKNSKDLAEYMKGVSWFQPNFLELSFTAGLNTNIIDGQDVYQYFKQNRIGEIDNSDILYVQNLANLDRITEGKNILTDVVVPTQKENEEIEEVPVLERIYNQNKISKKDKEELKLILRSKRKTKKDIENLKIILGGVLFRDNFVENDQDTKKQREEKKDSIEELINNL